MKYLFGDVPLFAGYLGLPLSVCYALGELLLQRLDCGGLLLQGNHFTGRGHKSTGSLSFCQHLHTDPSNKTITRISILDETR